MADHAKAVMQVAAAGTGVRLSDGSTNVIPTGPTEQVHAAWKLHARPGPTLACARAYYQGWDMHPAHLPDPVRGHLRFYRDGLPAAAARLAAYVAKAGGVIDEPATAKALVAYLLRGLDCGAVDAAEVLEQGQVRPGHARCDGPTQGADHLTLPPEPNSSVHTRRVRH